MVDRSLRLAAAWSVWQTWRRLPLNRPVDGDQSLHCLISSLPLQLEEPSNAYQPLRRVWLRLRTFWARVPRLRIF
jgi:hypothetical protein